LQKTEAEIEKLWGELQYCWWRNSVTNSEEFKKAQKALIQKTEDWMLGHKSTCAWVVYERQARCDCATLEPSTSTTTTLYGTCYGTGISRGMSTHRTGMVMNGSVVYVDPSLKVIAVEPALTKKGTVNWDMLRMAQRGSFAGVTPDRITHRDDADFKALGYPDPIDREVNIFLDVQSGLLYQGVNRHG
jgi:hypothetical protein